jgi:hypothetical protein
MALRGEVSGGGQLIRRLTKLRNQQMKVALNNANSP